MATRILTSAFENGFPEKFASKLKQIICKRGHFVFVASEFYHMPEKTDNYFKHFLKLFGDIGIYFEHACVVDGRMSVMEAQRAIMAADVIWLSGGDTPTQYKYFEEYGLIPLLQRSNGVIIGMSAGSINIGKTAICTITCEHDTQQIYKGLGLVDFSVEPHYDKNNTTEELLALSQEYCIYGLCDNGVILCSDSETEYIGDVFMIHKGEVEQISFN